MNVHVARLPAIDLTALVDELGVLRATVADAQAREKEIKATLVALGVTGDAVEGERYRAALSESVRTLIDWKTIAAKLKPSPQLVTAHTRRSTVLTLRVSARVAK